MQYFDHQKTKIPFDWVTIPAGEFLMGSDKAQDKDAYDDELPQHKLHLPAYKIARVPVTVVYQEGPMTLTKALRREYQLKQLTRQKKKDLIAGKLIVKAPR